MQERVDPVDRDLAARLRDLVAETRLEPLPLSREGGLPVVGQQRRKTPGQLTGSSKMRPVSSELAVLTAS